MAVKCKCGKVTKICVSLLLWTSQRAHSEAMKEAFVPCNKGFLR